MRLLTPDRSFLIHLQALPLRAGGRKGQVRYFPFISICRHSLLNHQDSRGRKITTEMSGNLRFLVPIMQNPPPSPPPF